jgi:hypothetical protein
MRNKKNKFPRYKDTTSNFMQYFCKVRSPFHNYPIPFRLSKGQKRLAKLVDDETVKRIIVCKDRQTGFTTFTAAYIYRLATTHKDLKIGIVVHNKNVIQYYKDILQMLSRQQNGAIASTWSSDKVVINNTVIRFISTVCDTRGCAYDLVIIDESDLVKDIEDIMESLRCCVYPDGRIITTEDKDAKYSNDWRYAFL